jgi:His-Xaa-Ser system protein HxsD
MNREVREVSFSLEAFGIDAIQRAAYRFVDRMAVSLHVEGNRVRCELHMDSAGPASDELIREFQKEALDQQLREKIAAETESIRHLILAHAFSKTGLS